MGTTVTATVIIPMLSMVTRIRSTTVVPCRSRSRGIPMIFWGMTHEVFLMDHRFDWQRQRQRPLSQTLTLTTTRAATTATAVTRQAPKYDHRKKRFRHPQLSQTQTRTWAVMIMNSMKKIP